MDEQLRERFSVNLKNALERNKRTQKELADYLGVSTATVSDWVNGKKIPRTDKLQSIANWLSTDLSGLLYEQREKVTYKIDILTRTAGQLPESDIDVLLAYAERLLLTSGKDKK